ncbi:MAG: hypothetical protein ACOYBM_06820 [Dethiobacteria bacterium]|nr:hypothetical protein [Bacillota bacterium]
MATKQKKNGHSWIVIISAWTFFLAVVFSIIAQFLMRGIRSLIVSIFILLLIIAVGVFFDMIGTAAAAADIAPLNAKAARKEYGAKMGVSLVQRAEQVANFANDVIGDISGIVSGVIGAIVVFRYSTYISEYAEAYISIMITAAIASLTVGGKAYGKTIAIKKSTEIMLFMGKIITRIIDHWPLRIIQLRTSSKRK